MNFLEPEFFEHAVLLNAVFKSANDGIIAIDEAGVIQLANSAVARLFQYTPEELIGRNVNIFMATPHHEKHDDYLKNYYQSGVKKIIGIGREVEGLRKDGSLFPVRLSVSEIKLKGHRFFTGIIHDLSEQRKAEENIKKLNAELEERVQQRTNEINSTLEKLLQANQNLKSEIKERKKIETLLRDSEKEIRTALEKEKELNELKSRFVTMASHEFRTPLSTILSSTALLGLYENKAQQDKKEKQLGRIRSAVTNMTNILNDFLSLSRMEEGEIRQNPQHFNFSVFCAEIQDEMKGLLKPGQTIQYQAEEITDEVYLDRNLFKNILFNLLSNAIKYSPPGATIYWSDEITEKQITITIRDEGIGIPKADQAYLFTRFFRAGNVTNIQGTGLGLNIVKQYVNLMNGSISFVSVEEEGTTFKIIIPKRKTS